MKISTLFSNVKSLACKYRRVQCFLFPLKNKKESPAINRIKRENIIPVTISYEKKKMSFNVSVCIYCELLFL